MSYLFGGSVQLGHIVPNFNAAIDRWLARGVLIWKNISAATHCSMARLCRQTLPPDEQVGKLYRVRESSSYGCRNDGVELSVQNSK